MEYVYFDSSSKIICSNNDLIYVKPTSIPITTTTAIPITTTTTTNTLLFDIYYGTSSNPIVTESIITSTFSKGVGYVGSPEGKLYIFIPGYSYKYWCIPDLSNDGDKVIKEIMNGTANVILVYDTYYKYYQLNPTSPMQYVTYGKIMINGTQYRIYRTIIKSSSSDPEYYVYSF